jgi:ATP-dependent exoDNAse (exonuclease V) alpha subunit
MANVDYAYAITCHKSQGSTYDSVFVTSEIHSNQDNELKAQ